MPVILPSPEELKRLTPSQRDKARRALWDILLATDEALEGLGPWRETDEEPFAPDPRLEPDAALTFQEAVLAHARRLEAQVVYDTDTEINARRAAWLEAS